MNLVEKSINLSNWVKEKTKDSKHIVELGAGFCNRLADVHENVQTKIGIEIWESYLFNESSYKNCIKIQGNLLQYKTLLKNYELDTVMIIDVLEHFDKDIAFDLIDKLKNDFNKIILMLPAGKYEQDHDLYQLGADYYQKHRSYWFDEDLVKLNFNENIIDNNFHNYVGRKENGLPTGCYFCIWEKIKN